MQADIIIDKDYYCWNGIRYIYFQCENNDTMTIYHDGYNSHEKIRCGGDSAYIITFPIASGKMITRHFCERHTKEFIDKIPEQGYNIIDRREEF